MLNCNYKSSFNKKKAFTLIELLIVIAIIGILFIVLVSKVDFATDKAKASGVQTDFRSFSNALETVSKENAGFNTFGWDTGDNAGAAPAGYTYTNATKDAGDRIRNSYDEGDTNLNGQYDDGEVWTGHKIYTENWTGCYTLINPGNASDMSAIFDLETAINKNLDPKLHIVIADDGTISMANGYKDPWSTQYHGQYITNASADAAAKWNTDASMTGSTGDNMDRGAILMYSNGANQKFGTKVKIVCGVVTAMVSQIDADHPDNNKMGADDYVLAVVYSYTNGYGETAAITEGFSNDQTFSTGNGGNIANEQTQTSLNITDGANSLFVLAAPTDVVIRVDEDVNNFKNIVKLDGVTLEYETDYTYVSGSTIITIYSSALENLNAGNTYNIEAHFTTGIARACVRVMSEPCDHNEFIGYEDCFIGGYTDYCVWGKICSNCGVYIEVSQEHTGFCLDCKNCKHTLTSTPVYGIMEHDTKPESHHYDVYRCVSCDAAVGVEVEHNSDRGWNATKFSDTDDRYASHHTVNGTCSCGSYWSRVELHDGEWSCMACDWRHPDLE